LKTIVCALKEQIKTSSATEKLFKNIKQILLKGHANYIKRMCENVNSKDLRIKSLEFKLLETVKELNIKNQTLVVLRDLSVYSTYVLCAIAYYTSIFD